jgi:hypothetical protein
MYQSSETGHATLGDAIKAGHSGQIDYGKSAQEAFEKYVTRCPMPNAQAACHVKN